MRHVHRYGVPHGQIRTPRQELAVQQGRLVQKLVLGSGPGLPPRNRGRISRRACHRKQAIQYG